MPNVESWLNIGVPFLRTAAASTSPRFGERVANGPLQPAPSFEDSQRSTPCSANPGVVAGAYSSIGPAGSCTSAGLPTDSSPEATVTSPLALDHTFSVEALSL